MKTTTPITTAPIAGEAQMPERRYKGQRDFLSQAILNVMVEQGPVTTGEVCIALGLDIQQVSSILSRMRKSTPMLPKRVYVCDWVYYDEYKPGYFARARYAIGDKPDKPKPKPDRKAARRRWYYKNKTPSSVFDLGLTRKQREERRRETLGSGRTDRRRPLQETQDTADGVQHGEQS